MKIIEYIRSFVKYLFREDISGKTSILLISCALKLLEGFQFHHDSLFC